MNKYSEISKEKNIFENNNQIINTEINFITKDHHYEELGNKENFLEIENKEEEEENENDENSNKIDLKIFIIK